MSFIFKKLEKHIWIFLSIIAFVYLLCGLYQRTPHFDDAWLSEQVYYLSTIGFVKSEFWAGLLNYENQLFVYHKAFIFLGAMVSKVFGFHLYILKSISLASLLIFAFVWVKYLKREINSKNAIWLGLFLVFISHLIYEYSFVYRPEVLMMLLGFLIFLSLRSYEKSFQRKYLVYASVLSGLSVVVHLNGLVFVFAGLCFLLSMKRWKSFFAFGFLSGAFSLLYFYDIREIQHLNTLLLQFKYDPALVGTKVDITDRLVNLLTEYKRWFSHSYSAALSLVFFYSLFKFWKRQDISELKFLLFCAIGLGLLSHGHTGKYMLMYLPLVLTVIVRAIGSNQDLAFGKLGYFLLILFFITNVDKSSKNIKNRVDIYAVNAQVFQGIPLGSKVVTYLPAIFGQIQNYDFIEADKFYYDIVRYEKKEFEVKTWIDRVNLEQPDFIVLHENYTRSILMKSLATSKELWQPFYEQFSNPDDTSLIILKSKK